MRFIRAWILGALVWLAVSLVVLLAYFQTSEPRHLVVFSGLLSLLWLEFGFAGIFHAIRKEGGRKVGSLFVISLLPPLLLLLIILAVAWWLGKLAYISYP